MTFDEAIRRIKNHMKVHKITEFQAIHISKALEMACEALKDKIAEKPIGDLHSCPHYRCPSCHRSVVLYEDDPKYPCCQWCGKKLNWNK